MAGGAITPADAERFYDRLGAKLDRFRVFEEKARLRVLEHGRFDRALSVLEFGCGTGRLAERLLDRHLPGNGLYVGIDVSAAMVRLARSRLERFGLRADVRKSDGSMRVGVADGAVDRFVATYVLDLLGTDDQEGLLGEAHRVLAPDGLLCLASLTDGIGPFSRWVSRTWTRIQRRDPARVGGCRPIVLRDLLPSDRWRIEHRSVLTMFGVPAEVIVARGVEMRCGVVVPVRERPDGRIGGPRSIR